MTDTQPISNRRNGTFTTLRFGELNPNTNATTKRDLIKQSLRFARIAYEFVEEFAAERKARSEGGNGEGSCEEPSVEELANARKADASCLMAATKAFDTALERYRCLKGDPLPGSRRPTDPPPRVVKPKNRLVTEEPTNQM